MAEGKQSQSTRRIRLLADKMFQQYEILVDAMSPPLGLEEVSRSELSRRWAAMSPDERMAELVRRGGGDLQAGIRSLLGDLGVL